LHTGRKQEEITLEAGAGRSAGVASICSYHRWGRRRSAATRGGGASSAVERVGGGVLLLQRWGGVDLMPGAALQGAGASVVEGSWGGARERES